MTTDGIVTVDLPQHIFTTKRGSFALKTFATSTTPQFQPARPDTGPDATQLWMCRFETPRMSRAETIYMEAWFARLARRAWCFRAYDPLRQLPLGVGNGYSPTNAEILFTGEDEVEGSLATDFRLLEGSTSARVAEAAQRGATSLLIEGIDTALEGADVLKFGDHFDVGLPSEMNLHMAGGAAVCDANGKARIELINPLWKRALAGDLIEFYRPTARFGLFVQADNGSVELVRSWGMVSEGTLVGIEIPYQEPY